MERKDESTAMENTEMKDPETKIPTDETSSQSEKPTPMKRRATGNPGRADRSAG
nr:hypothetical protein [Planococcus salinarum]